MTLARSHLVWFPLHPLGLLMSLSYPMSRLWFSIVLGWLCKVLVMRFGGSQSYRQLTPAFLGMVVGEVIMILFWLIIDAWQGRTGHQLMAG
jgi:Na+-translocating ferredoxin:NAD+ oxidoreductase RnfD subunit